MDFEDQPMSEYMEITNLEKSELRRMMNAITDLCNNTGFYMGKVAVQHPTVETSLMVHFSRFLMALEAASDSLQMSVKRTRVSKDQLTFDF